jgi:hypothetical protein
MIDVAAFLTEGSLSIGGFDSILALWRQQKAPATRAQGLLLS